MATRKEARKKSLLQILALIVVVAVIVAAVVIFQNWWNQRPGPDPRDITVTASVGDKSIDVAPYIACEPGSECPEGEVPNLPVGDDDTLKLDIPEEISDHEWKILSIYDDPAANDETAHGANETTEVSIPGSVDPIKASTGKRPRLKVVEISSMMIGTDDNGDETPLATVWSLTTMTDKEREASAEESTKASN